MINIDCLVNWDI